MRRLALLAVAYALIAVLVLPGSLAAQDEAETTTPEPAVSDQVTAPVPPAEEPEPVQVEPAPVPAEPAPAEPAPAEPAPAEPEPQFLADEREEEPPSARAAQSGTVVISDFQFTPATITINQGDTVTWTNDGPTPHSATASDGSFDTGVFVAGQSRSYTFTEAGTFAYICTPHPNMRGTVVVNAAQTGGDTPISDDDGTGGTAGDTPAGGEAAQTGPALPNTGVDSGSMLILGGLMLLFGAAAHRELRAQRPRPADRIGW